MKENPDTEAIEYRLANIEGYTLESLIEEIRRGGQFIVYQYCFSVIALTFERPSSACFVPADESKVKAGMKYTLLTLLFGWWGFPWGPFGVWRTVKVNLGGGVDVTGDIVLGLNEESFETGRAVLERAYSLYVPASNEKHRWIAKKLRPLFEVQTSITRAWLGRYINTEEPFDVIGLEMRGSDEEKANMIAEVAAAMKKILINRAVYDVVEVIPGENDLTDALIEQGEILYEREAF